MAQWLELQRGQQVANQQFLATQERVLLAFMQAGPTATTAFPAPLQPTHLQAPAAPLRPAAAPLRVAPAPNLAPARPHIVPASAVPYPGSPSPPAVPVVHAPLTPAAVMPAAVMPVAPQAAALHRQAVAATTNGDSPLGTNGHHDAAHAAALPGGPPSTEQFRNDLLQTVVLRTGYPLEMLNVDLPLEAGLGIDSIKTLEIFNALKQYHAFFRDDDQQDQDDVLVEFAQLKTLGKIIGAYDLKRQRFLKPAAGQASAEKPTVAESANGNGNGNGHAPHPAVPQAIVERFEVAAVAAPLDPDCSKKKISERPHPRDRG